MPFVKSFFLLILFISLPAQAGLSFEPYVGYAMGDLKYTGSATNSDLSVRDQSFAGNVDGFAYGARAGWMFGRFFLGGDYLAVRAQKKLDGMNESINWTNTSIFGVLALELGMGLRIWAGMTVTPHESEEATLPERTIYTGSAQKAGLGFHYRVPFAVNAEYIMYKFDKFEQAGVKGDIKDRYAKMDYSTILLSISFPFGM